MLAHIEGPIVDSFYDAALLSWGKPLNQPFPLLNSPATNAPIPCHEEQDELPIENGEEALAEHTLTSPCYDVNLKNEARRVNGCLHPKGDETRTEAVSRHLSMYRFFFLHIKNSNNYTDTTIQTDTTGDAPESDQEEISTPYMVLPRHEPFAMALVNREPFGCKYIQQEKVP